MRFSVAPMMDCTDRHDRYFLRLIAPDILLYTEMITAQALHHHRDPNYLLAFHPAEHPIALQLGGSDPALLVQAAKMGEAYGYDEINLNVGCPSPRVKSGNFGACLMHEPNRVADCVAAMQSVVSIPVTVKCRIGVDDNDTYEALHYFIQLIAHSGCKTFIIHARKAWLSGLSPKENREIPPLRYDIVRCIKQDFPALNIILNGGIKTLADIAQELPYVDGIMIGRAAYSNPYFLAEIQNKYYPDSPISTRYDIVQLLIPYIQTQLQNGVTLSSISRHILGLYMGQQGAAAWRRYISQHAYLSGAGVEVIEQALGAMTKSPYIAKEL
jgi:tRNA-dihydrouridine synthase A